MFLRSRMEFLVEMKEEEQQTDERETSLPIGLGQSPTQMQGPDLSDLGLELEPGSPTGL